MRSLAVLATITLLAGCANDTGLVDVKFAGSTQPNTDDTAPDGGGDSPDDTGDDSNDPPTNPDNPGGGGEEDPTDPGDPTNPGDPGDPSPNLTCGMVVIRDLRISGTHDVDFRPWADLDLTDPDASGLNAGVQPGTYDRVRFTMHKRTGEGSGGPGTGNPEVNHSIHLCGTWQGQAWDYTDDTTENVDRRDLGGVTIDADGPAKLFVVFDMTTWFDGIDLSSATVAPDGVVYLAHHENSGLQKQLRDNIKDSIHLANHAPH